jgi:hypothetical protein
MCIRKTTCRSRSAREKRIQHGELSIAPSGRMPRSISAEVLLPIRPALSARPEKASAPDMHRIIQIWRPCRPPPHLPVWESGSYDLPPRNRMLYGLPWRPSVGATTSLPIPKASCTMNSRT